MGRLEKAVAGHRQTSDAIRSGSLIAISWAILPPIEFPISETLSRPAASRKANMWSANQGASYRPRGLEEEPKPGRSTAMTR
jgi:hypothetical protein